MKQCPWPVGLRCCPKFLKARIPNRAKAKNKKNPQRDQEEEAPGRRKGAAYIVDTSYIHVNTL